MPRGRRRSRTRFPRPASHAPGPVEGQPLPQLHERPGGEEPPCEQHGAERWTACHRGGRTRRSASHAQDLPPRRHLAPPMGGAGASRESPQPRALRRVPGDALDGAASSRRRSRRLCGSAEAEATRARRSAAGPTGPRAGTAACSKDEGGQPATGCEALRRDGYLIFYRRTGMSTKTGGGRAKQGGRAGSPAAAPSPEKPVLARCIKSTKRPERPAASIDITLNGPRDSLAK